MFAHLFLILLPRYTADKFLNYSHYETRRSQLFGSGTVCCACYRSHRYRADTKHPIGSFKLPPVEMEKILVGEVSC